MLSVSSGSSRLDGSRARVFPESRRSNVGGIDDTEVVALESRPTIPGATAAGAATEPTRGQMKSFRLGEFFSGPGGLALGALAAARDVSGHVTLEHEWAVDIDPDSCRTFVDNVPGASDDSVHVGDARAFSRPDKLVELGDIDGFAFGFPCNDFSVVGEHKGLDGNFGGLYRTGVKVLKAKQPEWFVAENVGGIRSANGGLAFQVILSELEAVGYEVTPHFYRFEEYGVPQTRHRVIIVGIRKDLVADGIRFKVPAPTHARPELAPHLGLIPFVTSREALEKALPLGTTHTELTRQSQRVVDRLNQIDPGENAFNAKRLEADLKLNVRGATISQIYRRLHPERPSYTVTGSGGGGTHMYHWDVPRALTNRERARLQTFPDEHKFFGNRDSVRKQIGMAVPVNGARAIFQALFKTMLGLDYASIEPNLKAQVPEPALNQT